MAELQDYQAMLKEWYETDLTLTMILERSPLMALMPKKSVGGESVDIPILFADTAGGSGTFSTALANKGNVDTEKFQVTMNEDYALATIARKLMLQSRSNRGAFLPSATANIDGAFRVLRRSMAITAYRDGTGAKGQIGALAGGNTLITLANTDDIVNFQVNQKIDTNPTKTGAPGSLTGVVTITAVDKVNGILTVNPATAGAVDDYLYRDGDYDAVPTGLEGWIPDATPSATPFFGLDRTVDPVVFAGVRHDATGQLRYEALIDLQSKVDQLGDGAPTHVFTNPVDFRALIKEMEAQVTRPRPVNVQVPVRAGSTAMVGFSGIEVQGDSGTMQVFSDRFAPKNKAYALTLNEWRMGYLGDQLADIVGRDADEGMLVETGSDGFEIRVAGYSQMYTGAPGHNGVATNFGL